MSKYIKSFKTKAEYNTYIAGDHATPYTAYVEEEDKYYYGAKEPDWMEFEFPANPSGNFSFLNTLKSVVIPSGVTTLPQSAFLNCSNLQSVTIPVGVTSIPKECFMYCGQLSEVNLPEGLTTINSQGFYYCNSLNTITLPSTITWIGRDLSWGVKTATILATTPPTLQDRLSQYQQFNGADVIYVPASSVETYKAASGWSNWAAKIEAIPA